MKADLKTDFSKFPEVVAIVGSRSFAKSPVADEKIGKLVYTFVRKLPQDTRIVSGGAEGIDSYAMYAARRLQRYRTVFRPNKRIKSPQRYYARNRQIVEFVKEHDGIVVAFVDVTNMSGTQNTLNHAQRLGVPYIVYKFARLPLRFIGIDNYGTDVVV